MLAQEEISAIDTRWQTIALVYRELIDRDASATVWRYNFADDGLYCKTAQLLSGGLVLVQIERPIEKERRLLSAIANAPKDIRDLLHCIGNMQHVSQGIALFEAKIVAQEQEIEAQNKLLRQFAARDNQ